MSAHRSQGRIFWGLLLILVGGVFLLDRVHWLDLGDLLSRFQGHGDCPAGNGSQPENRRIHSLRR